MTPTTELSRADEADLDMGEKLLADDALVPFGWAPGGYMYQCSLCSDKRNAKRAMDPSDTAAKRASSCREHALEAAYVATARRVAEMEGALRAAHIRIQEQIMQRDDLWEAENQDQLEAAAFDIAETSLAPLFAALAPSEQPKEVG
jgi:hypothetical protein